MDIKDVEKKASELMAILEHISRTNTLKLNQDDRVEVLSRLTTPILESFIFGLVARDLISNYEHVNKVYIKECGRIFKELMGEDKEEVIG